MARPGLRVVVLGAGAWGTALAALAARQCPTLLWGRNEAQMRAMRKEGMNARHLPGIALPPGLQTSASLSDALDFARTDEGHAGLFILGVPVAGLDNICTLLAARLAPGQADALSLVWTCKGLEQDRARLPHAIVQSRLSALQHAGLGLGVLSGPSFAHEVARGLPVALTIATQQPATAQRAIQALHGEPARIYTSTDIVGVEVGGALKNIMAIACGISDGLGLGENARAALITRGLAEIQRLGRHLGGETATFYGLTGMGDLVLTATGDSSRNRQVGLAVAAGKTLNTILASGMTAEGVRCVRAVLQLSEAQGLDMPITRAVHRILFEAVPPRRAVAELLSRDAIPETGG
ncbi:MAG: NAD(P)H-dependent glycerol-3-phosphate dehydrogenase [Castellaniella sp.]